MKSNTTMKLPVPNSSFGNNMPRSGPIFREMSIARARFKHALKQCRLDEKMIHSNKLAYYMQCRVAFGKTLSIISPSYTVIVLKGLQGKLLLQTNGKFLIVE